MTARHRMAGALAPAGLVALGGCLGVALRATLTARFPAAADGWPWATFWINLTGSLVLGALLETLTRTGPDHGWPRTVRLTCGTGVLGGYTTYSTFAVEIVRRAQDGNAGLGAAYAFASIALGVLAAALGIRLAAATHHRLAGCRRGGHP